MGCPLPLHSSSFIMLLPRPQASADLPPWLLPTYLPVSSTGLSPFPHLTLSDQSITPVTYGQLHPYLHP